MEVMALDEAIRHAEEVAQGQSELYDCYLQHGEQGEHVENCKKCDAEHRQLAEWLKDYKRLLEQEPTLDKIRERVELEKLGYPPSAGYYRAIMKVLQIIDKCKAEGSGDKE